MTHVPIDIDSIPWDQYINVQVGGEQPRYFVGQRYMRGYGVLGSIGRFLLPIAKNLASSIGTEGVEAGTRVLKDVSEGRNLSDPLKEHTKTGFENLTSKMKQCGKGKSSSTSTSQRGGRKKMNKPKNAMMKKKTYISMYPERPASPSTPHQQFVNIHNEATAVRKTVAAENQISWMLYSKTI